MTATHSTRAETTPTLLDPKTLSRFPSIFHPRPVELPRPHRGESPEREPSDVILDEIRNIVSLAVREHDARGFRARVADSLPGFASLLDAWVLLERRTSRTAAPIREMLDLVEAWGGEHRADQLEHAMMLMRRSLKLVSRLAEQAPPDQEEDYRRAREWSGYRAGYAFCLFATAELTQAELFAHSVAETVFKDLIGYAREAARVSRMAYDSRFPEPDEEE